MLGRDQEGCYNSSLFQSTIEYQNYEKVLIRITELQILCAEKILSDMLTSKCYNYTS